MSSASRIATAGPKAALVTGVSRRAGIGAAIADGLREAGWSVFTTGWRRYDDTMPWGRDSDQPVDLEADLSRPEAVETVLAAAVSATGPLTALVTVHTMDPGGGLLEMTPLLFDAHMAVNVRSTLLLMQGFAGRFRGEPGTGRIVNLVTGPPQTGAIAYAASKGAIEWMTVSAATELGRLGITVNALNPGPNQTGWMSAEVEAEAARRTPLGRVGRPLDAARAIVFLCSEDAGWITGQRLNSDGGHGIAGSPFPGPL